MCAVVSCGLSLKLSLKLSLTMREKKSGAFTRKITRRIHGEKNNSPKRNVQQSFALALLAFGDAAYIYRPVSAQQAQPDSWERAGERERERQSNTQRAVMGGSRGGSVGSYSSGSANNVDVAGKYGANDTQGKIAKVTL